MLVQGPDRVLPTFRPQLTEKVEKKLKELGVEIIKGVHVKEIDEDGVQVGDEYIETHNAFWLAGVAASPAGKWLGAELTVVDESRCKATCRFQVIPTFL